MRAEPVTLGMELRKLLALPKVCDGIQTAAPSPTQVDPLRAATFLIPKGEGPFPAVLYCHAHGGEYSLGRHELTEGARWLVAPYAPDFLAHGFAVLAVDMPGFGARQIEGSEASIAKACLWRGQPLFGCMIEDLIGALDWLTARPEVDANRIATLGVSMGGAHAFWLAALDKRIAACAHICMLADVRSLIVSGAHARHGDYLTVPGLLRKADMGDVAALVAPRPQFVAWGEHDQLTPPNARRAAMDRLRESYGSSAALVTMVDPDAGHGETRKIREAALQFLDCNLAGK